MVIPWVGFPLSELIKQVQPKGNAKFVEFVTLADKAQMPGLRSGVLDWPYTEGLRMDEAMHPLTLVTLGAFGEMLRSKSLLFLGSSVEEYLRGVLSELVEIYGPSPHAHFAVFCEPPSEARRVLERTIGVTALFLPTTDALPEFLHTLAREVGDSPTDTSGPPRPRAHPALCSLGCGRTRAAHRLRQYLQSAHRPLLFPRP